MTTPRRMPRRPPANPGHPEAPTLEHDATLVVDDNVSLTLGGDALMIVGMSRILRGEEIRY